MDSFDYILDWKLRQGSHVFPGKDGGTCINEAAVVAAGFPCRPVRTVDDMPGCFSHPICRLAMHLNDEASDEERQLLLPFVTRLACADRVEVERTRHACFFQFVWCTEHSWRSTGATAPPARSCPHPWRDISRRPEWFGDFDLRTGLLRLTSGGSRRPAAPAAVSGSKLAGTRP
jgi:hypothetical protein